MTDYLNLHYQGKLQFYVSHYTEKVFELITPLKIINKYPELQEFYKGLSDAVKQQIVPAQVYSQLVKNLIGAANNNPSILKFIEVIIQHFNKN